MIYDALFMETAAPVGTKEEEYMRKGCRVTRSLLPGTDTGQCFTLTETGDDEGLVKVLAGLITRLAGRRKSGNVMVVGLGNRGMTADALGNRVLSGMEAGGQSPRLSLIAPQVSTVTGVESADIVGAVCSRIHPDMLILVDTLATSRYERLGRCYQLSNVPLVPGSGVGNAKQGYDRLHSFTLSLGVPLVIKLGDLGVSRLKDYVVTPADIDLHVERCGKNIARALNLALGRG